METHSQWADTYKALITGANRQQGIRVRRHDGKQWLSGVLTSNGASFTMATKDGQFEFESTETAESSLKTAVGANLLMLDRQEPKRGDDADEEGGVDNQKEGGEEGEPQLLEPQPPLEPQSQPQPQPQPQPQAQPQPSQSKSKSQPQSQPQSDRPSSAASLPAATQPQNEPGTSSAVEEDAVEVRCCCMPVACHQFVNTLLHPAGGLSCCRPSQRTPARAMSCWQST